VKHLVDGTSGLMFLRASYTMVTALLCGFLFVFYLNLLLFMVLDLAIASGQANASETQSFSGPLSAGIILALIMLTDGFAKALVIAGHFVYDTWSGHMLVKRFFFTSISDVIVDWIFFVFFICIPVVVAAYKLFSQADDWWDVTALSWFSCVLVFYTAFACNIIWVEVSAAYNFVKNRADTDKTSFIQVLKRCILLRQVQEYSAKRRATYLSRSTFTSTEDTEVSRKADIFENTRRETIGLYSRLTEHPRLTQFFTVMDPPVNLYSIEDVADYRPFLTRQTWSLERVFCRPRDSRYITVIKGPGSLRRAQLRSSVFCSFVGTGLILLIFVAFLWWLGIGGAYITFIFVIAAYFAARALDNAYRLAMVAQDLIDVNVQLPDVKKHLAKLNLGGRTSQLQSQDDPAPEEKEEEEAAMTAEEQELHDNASQAIYLVTQYQRTREATEKLCWIMFGVEMVVYYWYPWLCLYILGNSAVGSLFLIVAATTGIRHYVNAAVAVEETGNMSLIDGKTEDISWQNKSRFNEIIETVTVSKTKYVWKRILQGMASCCCCSFSSI
jgi:ABC-type multidrug transport system fused ATPase/permease subunit